MLGLDTMLASGVAVPVFLPKPVSRAVKDLAPLTGSTDWLLIVVSLAAKLVSDSVKMLLTSALPLLLTASLTVVYNCKHSAQKAQITSASSEADASIMAAFNLVLKLYLYLGCSLHVFCHCC